MTAASEPIYRSRASSLALRYALRELRSGLRGFYVFIACIALGVMAIAGVGSVAASLSEGLTREGRTLLGGDVAFSLIQREAKPEEIAFLRARGQVSVAAALRVMARSGDGKLALVELKAVDGNYPMLGALTLDPKMPMADLLAERQDTSGTTFGAAVDSTLLARLDLKLGDRIGIGNASFQIRSVVTAEPDSLSEVLNIESGEMAPFVPERTTQLFAVDREGIRGISGDPDGNATISSPGRTVPAATRPA